MAALHVPLEEHDKVFGHMWGWRHAPHPQPLEPLAWGPPQSIGPRLAPCSGLPRTANGALCARTTRFPIGKGDHLDLRGGRGNESASRPAGKSLGSSASDDASAKWGWCLPARRSMSTPSLPPITASPNSQRSK